MGTSVPFQGTIEPVKGTSELADGLATALFPESRRAILGLLYSHPDEAFYLRQIVDLAGLAMGQAQRELQR